MAFTTPEQREAYTAWVFSKHEFFLPGGACFKEGLFGWETEAIQTPPFPKRGHLLVGGCGGGRDVKGLAELGYTITAFDPAEELVEGAKQVVADFPGCSAFCASYGGFIRAAQEDGTEFSKALAGAKFDGVVLSWGSFCHIPTSQERLEVLKEIRRIAPEAVVFLSFYDRPEQCPQWHRKFLRWVVTRMGKTPAEDGDILYMKSGFIHTYTRPELEALVREAGYAIVRGRWYSDPQPYVLLQSR